MDNKIISEKQFGFRKNHSCELALLNLIFNIQNHLNNNCSVACLYLDLQKAFDVLNHKILLNKLEAYGIENITLKWLNSYLSNRSIPKLVNNTVSNKNFTKDGVPQRSILGPLLFLVFKILNSFDYARIGAFSYKNSTKTNY